MPVCKKCNSIFSAPVIITAEQGQGPVLSCYYFVEVKSSAVDFRLLGIQQFFQPFQTHPAGEELADFIVIISDLKFCAVMDDRQMENFGIFYDDFIKLRQ